MGKKKRKSVLLHLNSDFKNKLSSMFGEVKMEKNGEKQTKKVTPKQKRKIPQNKIYTSPNISPNISPNLEKTNNTPPPPPSKQLKEVLQSVGENQISLERDLYKLNSLLLGKLYNHIDNNDFYIPTNINYIKETVKMLGFGFLVGMNSAFLMYCIFN